MASKSLVKIIKSPNLDNLKEVILIYGKEEYLKLQFLQAIKKDNKNLNILWGDELELEKLISLFSSNSLFSSKTVVAVKNFEEFIKKLKKDELKRFLDFCIKLPKGNKLILISKLEKLPSKEPYKTLQNAGDVLASTPLTEKGFTISLKKKFISENIEISDELLVYLASLLKNDLLYAKQEIEKLILYIKDKNKITKEDIDRVIYPKVEESIFNFIHKFFTKDIECLKILRALLDTGYHPFEIQSLILYQGNKLLLYKTLKGRKSEKQIFLELGLKFPFQIKQLKEEDKKFSREELINLIKDLYMLEVEQKVFYKDINKSLESFILKFLIE